MQTIKTFCTKPYSALYQMLTWKLRTSFGSLDLFGFYRQYDSLSDFGLIDFSSALLVHDMGIIVLIPHISTVILNRAAAFALNPVNEGPVHRREHHRLFRSPLDQELLDLHLVTLLYF